MLKRLMVLFCCAAIGLTACAGGGGRDASLAASETQQAKGRYLEEENFFPGDIQHIYDIRQDSDGALEVFAYLDGYTYGVYRSTDDGQTWTKETPPWLQPLHQTAGSIQAAFYMKDGGVFAEPYDEGTAEGYRVTADGAITPIEKLPSEEGAGMNGVLETDSGDLVFSNYFSLTQSGSDYKKKFSYNIDGIVMSGSYAVSGNILAVCENDSIRLYDLTDGSLKTEILQEVLREKESNIKTSDDLSNPKMILSFDETGEAFYYCDSTGLYRRLVEGSVSERLVTGNLSSLSMPSVFPQKLLLGKDGTFYVCAYANGRYSLLRYHYDAQAPTEPSTELKLYTLRDNKTIRQAIGLFQRQYPDVKVTCQVGADDDGAVPDALRAFNTQLLAGDGPDLIVLDGLPLESYIEKGVLADLSEPLSQTTAALLPNVVEAFRHDGALYALPARFSVPMMGLPSGAENVKDLETLAAWLEGEPNARLQYTIPDSLVRQFYPILSPGWFGEDGALDQEAFSRSLTLLKRISQIPGWGNIEYRDDLAKGIVGQTNLEFDSVAMSGKGLSAAIGPLSKFRAAAAVDAAIQGLGGGSLKPVESEKGAVFIPSALLGVNATGKQQEIAQQFMKFALSGDVLQYELDDGLPVNREALLKNAENPYSDDEIETNTGIYYAVSQKQEDGTSQMFEMNALWPSEVFMQELIDTLGSVKTVSMEDATLLKMVLDETADYFDGSKSLEETVAAFAQKIGIYRAEQ